jgi:LysM repeat protein
MVIKTSFLIACFPLKFLFKEKLMKKKNLYTVLITMLVLSFVLTACPGGAPPTPAETTTQVQQAVAPTPPPAPTPVVQRSDIILDGAQSYTVVSGDTLSSISRRFYNNDDYFPIIMLGSSGVVSDPDKIEPGTRLTIPNLRRNLDDSGAKARIKSYFGEVASIYDRRDRSFYAGDLRRLANSL